MHGVWLQLLDQESGKVWMIPAPLVLEYGMVVTAITPDPEDESRVVMSTIDSRGRSYGINAHKVDVE